MALLLTLAACAGPDGLSDPDAGRTLGFDPDALLFDLEARALLADSAGGIRALVAVDPRSLVFEATETGAQEARYQLVVSVRASDAGTLVREQVWTDTLRAPDASAARRLEPVVRAVRWAASPGSYLVEARLDDLGVQREGTRRLRLVVPEAETAPMLGRLLVDVKRDGRYVSHLARTLAHPGDSMRVRVAVRGAGAQAVLRVARLPSDTTVARPLHWLSPSRGSLVYQGVRVDDAREVYRSAPHAVDGRKEVAFTMPPLEPGLYRFEVVMAGASLEADEVSAERYLSVFGAGHPYIETLDDLIEALGYIAYERELAYIQDGGTSLERRARYDGFWGTLLGDRRVAANVVRLYYERVEEANRRFSTVKTGWKTDRGMLYVLLGPPGYVQLELDGETWFYGNGLREDAALFRFRQATDFGQPPGWRPLVLERQAAYEGVWATHVRQWRRGRVR